MLRLLADENFNNDVVAGLRRRLPAIDLVRVQDVPGLPGKDDPAILAWAAAEGRIVITHDISTMTAYANDRVSAGLRMPGLFAVPTSLAVRQAIDDLLLLAECSLDDEWEGQNRYLPLS